MMLTLQEQIIERDPVDDFTTLDAALVTGSAESSRPRAAHKRGFGSAAALKATSAGAAAVCCSSPFDYPALTTSYL